MCLDQSLTLGSGGNMSGLSFSNNIGQVSVYYSINITLCLEGRICIIGVFLYFDIKY